MRQFGKSVADFPLLNTELVDIKNHMMIGQLPSVSFTTQHQKDILVRAFDPKASTSDLFENDAPPYKIRNNTISGNTC